MAFGNGDGIPYNRDISDWIDTSKTVDVYRNLTHKCFSIKQKGIVRYHTPYIALTDVKFVVSDKGRERVRKEKCKNVHAVMRGFCIDPSIVDKKTNGLWVEITYNPYIHDGFVDVDDQRIVKTAKYVDACLFSSPSLIGWGISYET